MHNFAPKNLCNLTGLHRVYNKELLITSNHINFEKNKELWQVEVAYKSCTYIPESLNSFEEVAITLKQEKI